MNPAPSKLHPSAAVVFAALGSGPVWAQEEPERPSLPAISLAGDDGAATTWRNPGSLALDPDQSWYVAYTQQMSAAPVRSVAAATHAGPLATGVSYRATPEGVSDWWTLSSALSLKLGPSLALGTHVGWQLPEGPDNNFVTWDLGTTWRPLRWLGFGLVAQNLFAGASTPGVEERWGGGLVLRPIGDRIYLSADMLSPMPAEARAATGASIDPVVQGALRVLPVEGLVVRGWGTSEAEVGLGVEVYWGRAGVGGFATAPITDQAGAPVAMAYLNSAEGEQRLMGSARRVVEIDLDGSYPYTPATGLFSRSEETYLHLVQRLERAADDDNVRGLIVHIDRTPFSLAQIEELRAALSRARDAGKPVVVYLDRSTSNAAYLLAAAADRIYLHPATDLDLIGLSTELTFLRGTLDLLGVEPQVASRGKYKSAPESFTRTGSSEANRQQTQALLDDLSNDWASALAQGRGKDLDRIWELVDGGPYAASEALEIGLVDGLAYPDELEDLVEGLFVDDYQLSEEYGLEDETSGWRPRREIAVVPITGAIVTGESATPGLFGGGFMAGSDTVSRQLRQAGRTSSVKAVVLRVDSPGGSSFASDDIWRAVEKLKEKDKPVIVSMGGVAASGGYYVSAGAERIFALPSTITGSIGVYAGPLPSLEGLFDKIGVETEIYTRGRKAAMYSLSKPLDAVEYAALDRLVAHTYEQFKQRVADGRGMKMDAVEAVAQGRVWSGRAALDQGLVDALGGFTDAVAAARDAAGIPEDAEVHLVAYSEREGPAGDLGRRSLRVAARAVIGKPMAAPPLLPPELEAIARWRRLSDDRVWAIMPYHLSVE